MGVSRRQAPREAELLLAIAPDRRREGVDGLVVHAGLGAVVVFPGTHLLGLEGDDVDDFRSDAGTGVGVGGAGVVGSQVVALL